MSYPVVLIHSRCPETSAIDIISNIRKIAETEQSQDNLYLHEIKTKYYTTQIAFHPLESINNLTEDMKHNVEGFLIYFDSNDRTFLDELPSLVEFIKENNIEFNVMLCNELFDEVENGITFSCIKNCYNMLDIIELGRVVSDEDGDEDPFNPSGYEELAQALRSVIWSNVDVNNVTPSGHVSAIGNGLLAADESNELNSSNEELNVEDELEMFENLLNTVTQFRPLTNEMSREDRLNHAENVAQMFERLIMQDEELSEIK